jgi:cytochrome c peroxidase
LKLITKLFLFLNIIYLSSCSKQENFWSPQELRILSSFKLTNLNTNTEIHSNRFANNKDAASFGKELFFDVRFSKGGSMSCASCHQPKLAFTDGLAKAQGIHKTGRNTQTILGAAHLDWFYWDGRKDSLWSQALVPFEAADEMASTRIKVLRIIGTDKNYLSQYEKLFGEFPQNIFNKNINVDSGPWGNTKTRDNWFRIPVSTQKIINRAYSNIGKSIAAYQRSIPIPQTKLDSFLTLLFDDGESKANTLLTQNELSGLKLFIDQNKTHCLRCHNGPLLTNSDFHNIGSGNLEGKHLDFGRFFGIQAVAQDEFNCFGQYSDAKPEQCKQLRFLSKQVHGEMMGAFKTPTLRYLNKTKPYFHDGRFSSLEQIMDHYISEGKKDTELPKLSLTQDEVKQLISFLNLLNMEE